ncbi:MAG TPA: helix-turn-helix domain-containing protein [Streptosporangiaceae bacterium]|nr:helix-turn-helix domain-containing protein [Streptosporangiaceae bacterium]
MSAEAAEIGEPLMTPEQLAGYLGGDITPGTLAHWRHRGGGPPYLKTGHRVRYRPEDVREWLAAGGRESGKVPA